MASLAEKINELSQRIQELSAQQATMNRQLLALMHELDALKQQAAITSSTPTTVPDKVVEFTETITAPGRLSAPAPASMTERAAADRKRTTSFEEFIGKNLASTIGILVTIVGIFIGARYAIEHELVSPVVRVVSGYGWGIAFVGVALRLKKKYEAYSAVLMGGGLCVLYFITYTAWGFYQLIPQTVAFGLMLLFTITIVYMATWYNRIIIAHLGQIGAYAIPFLLSDNAGRYEILFTYIAVINAGILVLSFFKYWKSLFHVAFILTWLIFGAWFIVEYDNARHFTLGAVFLTVYFIMFYATFLSYKLIKKEQYGIWDIYLLLSNAFVFYGIGYGLMSGRSDSSNLLGAFTVVNALVHFVVSVVIRKLKLADCSLYYLVLGLVIVFLAIAVPVQFDGNWVTLLWTAEAVLLFAIGRTRQVPAYEQLAGVLVILGFGSLVQDWFVYGRSTGPYHFPNITFVTGLLVVIALGVINWLNFNRKWRTHTKATAPYQFVFDYLPPALLLIAGYFLFAVEIDAWFRVYHIDMRAAKVGKDLWKLMHANWNAMFLYSEGYMLLLFVVHKRWVRSQWLSFPALMGTVILSVFLIANLLPVSNRAMADYYLTHGETYFGTWNVVMRYLVLGAMAGLLVMGSKEIEKYTHEPTTRKAWWIWICVVILGAISYEYLNWTSLSGKGDQYKVGLSIIWGIFALLLVIYGIWKKSKHIRLAAIVLFVATIVKLFVYDLAEAGTITKTVSFISLGVILLLVSYLYNRYKDVLFGEDKPETDTEAGHAIRP